MTYIAAPVHTLADFQIEYNGLLMGNGTPYFLPPDGSWAFFDMAAVKTMDQARTWADGSWSGPDFADVLLPSVNFHVDAADPVAFANLVTAFWQAFGPQAVGQPLWVKLPNMPVRGVAAKAHKRMLPATNIWSTHAEGALQWRCPDPAWQSASRSLVLAGGSAGASGMTFPLFTQASPPVARTNLATNPSLEGGTSANWLFWAGTGGAATASVPTSGGAFGADFLRVTWTAAPSSGGGAIYDTGNTLSPSTTYTLSMYVRSSVAVSVLPQFQLYNGATPTTGGSAGSATAIPANVWTRVSQTFTTGASDNHAQLRAYVPSAGITSTATFDADAMLIENAASAGTYFDGSTAATPVTVYAWSGTPNASTSTASPAPVLDFGVTGVGSASGTLTNVGNTPAWPVVVITQPGSIIIDGFTVTYAQAIPAGQTVTIDYKAGTATLTGDIDRTTQLTVRQFSPVTSSSSAFFSAASGTATLTIADIWR
jgi:hypothetical protein